MIVLGLTCWADNDELARELARFYNECWKFASCLFYFLSTKGQKQYFKKEGLKSLDGLMMNGRWDARRIFAPPLASSYGSNPVQCIHVCVCLYLFYKRDSLPPASTSQARAFHLVEHRTCCAKDNRWIILVKICQKGCATMMMMMIAIPASCLIIIVYYLPLPHCPSPSHEQHVCLSILRKFLAVLFSDNPLAFV